MVQLNKLWLNFSLEILCIYACTDVEVTSMSNEMKPLWDQIQPAPIMYCYELFKMLQGVFHLRALHLNACLQREGVKEAKTVMITNTHSLIHPAPHIPSLYHRKQSHASTL